jgi:Family of unknown function (DUF5752)
MTQVEPFHFFTERRLVQLTGLSARNLPELATNVRSVSGSCIFYHTHHEFLSHHFEKPVVYNDFAVWVREALQENALAEKLGAIDLLSFTTVRQLREAILFQVESCMNGANWHLRICPDGDEFHFCKSKSFILATGITAFDPPDFFAKLPSVTTASLYFHFLEARLRLGKTTNDFSQWLASHGQDQLAEAINHLDPYRVTLEEFKSGLIALGAKYGMC